MQVIFLNVLLFFIYQIHPHWDAWNPVAASVAGLLSPAVFLGLTWCKCFHQHFDSWIKGCQFDSRMYLTGKSSTCQCLTMWLRSVCSWKTECLQKIILSDKLWAGSSPRWPIILKWTIKEDGSTRDRLHLISPVYLNRLVTLRINLFKLWRFGIEGSTHTETCVFYLFA